MEAEAWGAAKATAARSSRVEGRMARMAGGMSGAVMPVAEQAEPAKSRGSRVLVEAAARLLAEVAGLHLLRQQGAGAVLGVLEAVEEDVEDGEAGVEADEVGQRQRAHRVVHAELHDGVDVLGCGHALVEAEDGLVDHRHEDAVADEAG